MDSHSIDRVLDPRIPERRMEDIENAELGRKLIETLRTSDTPLDLFSNNRTIGVQE